MLQLKDFRQLTGNDYLRLAVLLMPQYVGLISGHQVVRLARLRYGEQIVVMGIAGDSNTGWPNDDRKLFQAFPWSYQPAV